MWYRHRPSGGRPIPRSHRWILALLFGLSLVAVTPNLRGDGVGYYAFVASALIDGDLQFENEFRHSDPGRCHLVFDAEGMVRPDRVTPTGHVRNIYSVGPALFWAPFFLLADLAVTLHNALVPARAVAADGYSWPYLTACAVGSALFGFLALCFSYAVARSESGAEPALLAVLGIWLASSLGVYMYLLPFMAHASSAFIDSVFVWYWYRTWREPDAGEPRVRSARQWLLLGGLAGLVFTTYHQGALLWLFIALDGLALLWAWRRDAVPLASRALWILQAGTPLGLGIAVGVLPTLVAKWILYGSPFAMAYASLPWFWSAPQTLHVLFSAEHGLWAWTPVLLLACLGLIPLTRRHPALGWRCLLSFLACLYMIGSKLSWHGGSSFGNRYFLILTPVFALGLAEFLRVAAAWLEARRRGLGRPLVVAGLVLLAVWNAGFVFQWAANLVPNRGPIDFGQMARNQVTTVPAMLARNVVPILFDRANFVEAIETEDLGESESLELRPGVCKR